jgi:hypothetical protein
MHIIAARTQPIHGGSMKRRLCISLGAVLLVACAGKMARPAPLDRKAQQDHRAQLAQRAPPALKVRRDLLVHQDRQGKRARKEFQVSARASSSAERVTPTDSPMPTCRTRRAIWRIRPRSRAIALQPPRSTRRFRRRSGYLSGGRARLAAVGSRWIRSICSMRGSTTCRPTGPSPSSSSTDGVAADHRAAAWTGAFAARAGASVRRVSVRARRRAGSHRGDHPLSPQWASR